MVALVVSFISLSISAFGFLFLRWYIKRETSASRLLADYQAAVDQMTATIHSTTDRDMMLVEERIKTLKKFLEDADRRIAVFVKEMDRSREGQAIYSSLGRGIRAALDSRPPQPGQPSLFASDLPDSGEEAESSDGAAGGKKRSGKGHDSNVQDESGERDEISLPSSLPSAKSKLKAQIAEMSARSVPRQEIASKLGISVAEVDLALNLLNRG